MKTAAEASACASAGLVQNMTPSPHGVRLFLRMHQAFTERSMQPLQQTFEKNMMDRALDYRAALLRGISPIQQQSEGKMMDRTQGDRAALSDPTRPLQVLLEERMNGTQGYRKCAALALSWERETDADIDTESEVSKGFCNTLGVILNLFCRSNNSPASCVRSMASAYTTESWPITKLIPRSTCISHNSWTMQMTLIRCCACMKQRLAPCQYIIGIIKVLH